MRVSRTRREVVEDEVKLDVDYEPEHLVLYLIPARKPRAAGHPANVRWRTPDACGHPPGSTSGLVVATGVIDHTRAHPHPRIRCECRCQQSIRDMVVSRPRSCPRLCKAECGAVRHAAPCGMRRILRRVRCQLCRRGLGALARRPQAPHCK